MLVNTRGMGANRIARGSGPRRGEERVRWGGVPNKHHREMWAKRVGTEWGNVAGGEGRIDVCV